MSGNREQRDKLRGTVQRRLEQLLTIEAQLPNGDTFRLPLGRYVVRFRFDGKLVFEFEPWLTGVDATLAYILALLLDAERGLAKNLRRCRACTNGATCGKFFRLSGGPKLYCDDCVKRVRRKQATLRQRRHRKP